MPVEIQIVAELAKRLSSIRKSEGYFSDIGRLVHVTTPLDPFRDRPCVVLHVNGSVEVSDSALPRKTQRTLELAIEGIGEASSDQLRDGMRIGHDIERALLGGRLHGECVFTIEPTRFYYSPSDQRGTATAYCAAEFRVGFVKEIVREANNGWS